MEHPNRARSCKDRSPPEVWAPDCTRDPDLAWRVKLGRVRPISQRSDPPDGGNQSGRPHPCFAANSRREDLHTPSNRGQCGQERDYELNPLSAGETAALRTLPLPLCHGIAPFLRCCSQCEPPRRGGLRQEDHQGQVAASITTLTAVHSRFLSSSLITLLSPYGVARAERCESRRGVPFYADQLMMARVWSTQLRAEGVAGTPMAAARRRTVSAWSVA